MWTREELKSRAKFVLSSTYWNSVLAILIIAGIAVGFYVCIMAVCGAIGIFTFISGLKYILLPFYSLSITAVIAEVFVILAAVFAFIPLHVGLLKYFMNNRHEAPRYSHIFYAFQKERYFKIICSVVWKDLFIFLWGLPSLIVRLVQRGVDHYYPIINHMTLNSIIAHPQILFIQIFLGLLAFGLYIPVIIKSLSYMMTEYILTDNSQIGYRRALKLSIAMTDGHKFKIFVLGLSFIGWLLLAVLPCGIGLLFLAPYLISTFTELYAKLRDNALRQGLCSFKELNFENPGSGLNGR